MTNVEQTAAMPKTDKSDAQLVNMPIEVSNRYLYALQTADIVQILQKIAHNINHYKDLGSFMLACKITYNAIEGDNHSFWHAHFMLWFDKPQWTREQTRLHENTRYRQQWIQRMVMLHGNDYFTGYDSRRANIHLIMLQELMLQSYGGVKGEASHSHNLKHIQDSVRRTNIATPFRSVSYHHLWKNLRPLGPYNNALLPIIQCMLAPVMLNQSILGNGPKETLAFHGSQSIVYDPFSQFVGSDKSIDFTTCISYLNFWRHYFIVSKDSFPYNVMESLTLQPQFWTEKLSNDIKLGQHWLGFAAFLPDDQRTRFRGYAIGDPDEILQDLFVEEDTGEPSRLSVEVVSERDHYWPQIFAAIVAGWPVRSAIWPARRRAASDVDAPMLRLAGIYGEADQETYKVSGWLTPLPSQFGIPGWARISLMIYCIKPDTGLLDEDNVYACDGVLMAGGKIMVGRWETGLNTDEPSHGPFIWWNVD